MKQPAQPLHLHQSSLERMRSSCNASAIIWQWRADSCWNDCINATESEASRSQKTAAQHSDSVIAASVPAKPTNTLVQQTRRIEDGQTRANKHLSHSTKLLSSKISWKLVCGVGADDQNRESQCWTFFGLCLASASCLVRIGGHEKRD